MTADKLFQRSLSLATLTLALGFICSAPLTVSATPVGTWNSSFTTAQGQKMESTLTIKKEGDKLSGAVTGRNGNETPLDEVTLAGDQLSFKLTRERNGEKFTAKVVAKLSGDTLKGKLDSNFGGEDHSFDWEANRAKAAGNVTGAWKYSIDAGGNTMNLVLDLKQEGETVTGKVRVGEFETPITEGKLSGDAITFKIPVDTGDTKFTSKYKGTLNGDDIKGNIESDWGGETHNYDWVANRAKAANAAGTWSWALVTDDGDKINLSLKLKQDGDKISGVVILGESETSISEGLIKEGQISLKVTRVQDGTTQTAKFKGTLEGNSIKGKIDSDWSGEQRMYDWNAKRSI